MTKRKRRNYTNEFKEEVVKLVTDQGYSVAEAARNLGVTANLLGRWKKESEQPENDSTSVFLFASISWSMDVLPCGPNV